MREAEIYKALGDPLRLQIVTRLASGSTYTIGELSKNLGVTRQGARKQLQVLVSAELVQLIPKGRETVVALEVEKLTAARQFIAQLERQWDQRLQDLKALLEDGSDKP
ncbi:helix-turn-helix domain-containing protein [Dasania sp. GY-MA-18]|uniref:Winged helix-turn-helix domain-containing protein n=1 Tax=Dasania phycosphaerae TaxID=2950436 RepID=A0A9J6RLN8_9GAMM|nr:MULTISPECIES: winged helix-turn-helix domain-containing protein [Dasania]MCR8922925.1 helix-turn-helix domain-containing protein [Dasania sp. GY-MA-18]MCZ0865356.1 winged helix-turn-helix domain-containing protein [Dasania phycosphaerae]MCZ0869081.1 winged helix-turn-helix domain-containing protein [Dasania phycosphaerae]